MKIKLEDFRLGLRKSFGIVNTTNNYEYLQSFYLKPSRQGGGACYLAGSNGTITFLSKINAELDETDTEDVILIPASKLFQMAQYSSADLEIKNGKYVLIKSGRAEWKVAKLDSDYIDDLPFEELDNKEFDDKFGADDLRFILNSLLPITAGTNTLNTNFRQIYLDTEKAYTSDNSVVSYIKHATSKPYILPDSVVKCIQDLLISYNGPVKFRYVREETMVIVSLTDEVFLFTVNADELMPIDDSVDLPLDSHILVDRAEMVRSLHRVMISASEDSSNVFMTATGDDIELHSENESGEECHDYVKVLKSQVEANKKMKLTASNLIRVLGIIKDPYAVIRYKSDDSYLVITDKDKKCYSLMMSQ